MSSNLSFLEVNKECLSNSFQINERELYCTGAVMVWGYFGGEIAVDFIQIKGIMQKGKYHAIWQRHAIPSGCCSIGQNFVLQHKHSPKFYTNYLKSKEDKGILQIITWSPQSPDLSPIELVWDEINHKI